MCVNEGVDDWWHLNKNDKSVGQIHLSSNWMPHEDKSEKAEAAKKETENKPFVPPPQMQHPQQQQMQQPMMQQ